MKLKDLTLEKVKAAYKKTGLVPGRGEITYDSNRKFEKGKRACPLQALGQVQGKKWSKVLDDELDTSAFYEGYDGLLCYTFSHDEAFKLGKAVARAFGFPPKEEKKS